MFNVLFSMFVGKVEVYLNPNLCEIISLAIPHHWVKGFGSFFCENKERSILIIFITLNQLLTIYVQIHFTVTHMAITQAADQ